MNKVSLVVSPQTAAPIQPSSTIEDAPPSLISDFARIQPPMDILSSNMNKNGGSADGGRKRRSPRLQRLHSLTTTKKAKQQQNSSPIASRGALAALENKNDGNSSGEDARDVKEKKTKECVKQARDIDTPSVSPGVNETSASVGGEPVKVKEPPMMGVKGEASPVKKVRSATKKKKKYKAAAAKETPGKQKSLLSAKSNLSPAPAIQLQPHLASRGDCTDTMSTFLSTPFNEDSMLDLYKQKVRPLSNKGNEPSKDSFQAKSWATSREEYVPILPQKVFVHCIQQKNKKGPAENRPPSSSSENGSNQGSINNIYHQNNSQRQAGGAVSSARVSSFLVQEGQSLGPSNQTNKQMSNQLFDYESTSQEQVAAQRAQLQIRTQLLQTELLRKDLMESLSQEQVSAQRTQLQLQTQLLREEYLQNELLQKEQNQHRQQQQLQAQHLMSNPNNQFHHNINNNHPTYGGGTTQQQQNSYYPTSDMLNAYNSIQQQMNHGYQQQHGQHQQHQQHQQHHVNNIDWEYAQLLAAASSAASSVVPRNGEHTSHNNNRGNNIDSNFNNIDLATAARAMFFAGASSYNAHRGNNVESNSNNIDLAAAARAILLAEANTNNLNTAAVTAAAPSSFHNNTAHMLDQQHAANVANLRRLSQINAQLQAIDQKATIHKESAVNREAMDMNDMRSLEHFLLQREAAANRGAINETLQKLEQELVHREAAANRGAINETLQKLEQALAHREAAAAAAALAGQQNYHSHSFMPNNSASFPSNAASNIQRPFPEASVGGQMTIQQNNAHAPGSIGISAPLNGVNKASSMTQNKHISTKPVAVAASHEPPNNLKSAPKVAAADLSEIDIQSAAKLPVAYVFDLNDASKHLAQVATNKWKAKGVAAVKKLRGSGLRVSIDGSNCINGILDSHTPKASSGSTTPKTPALLISSEAAPNLPDGWLSKTFQRMSGKTVGKEDTYFYSPQEEIKFRSMKSCKTFIQILNEQGVNGSEKNTLKLYRERGHRL